MNELSDHAKNSPLGWNIVALLLLAAAAFFVGCGGGGKSSSGGGSSSLGTPPGTPVVPPPVIATAITQFADDPTASGTQVVVTSPNTLVAGAIIVITGSGGTPPAGYDGTYAVVSATPTQFVIAEAFTTNPGTGFWQSGGGVIAGCNTTGATSTITLSNAPSRFTGAAPLAVFFDATGSTATTTARPFHNLQYGWDFGDAGSGNWANGSRTASRNEATGPVAAHVYEAPGTYIVSLSISNGTNTVTNACVQIAVLDPNVVFAGTNTICYSNGGSFVGCPAGASQVSASSDFVTLIAAATGGQRLLLERGGVWNAPSQGQLRPFGGPGILGAYGAGAAPRVVVTGGNANVLSIGSGAGTVTDWRLMDLEFDLQSSTLNGHGVQAFGDLSQILFQRLNMHDGRNGYTFSFSGTDLWDQVFIVDNIVQNSFGLTPGSGGGVGVFVSGTRFAFLGNLVDDTTLTEHNTRFPYLAKAIISNNTLRRPANGKANIKLHGTTGFFTEMVVISDNRLASDEAGTMLEVQPQSAGVDERIRNVIVERNWFEPLGPVFDRPFAAISAQEVTFRNNLGDMTPGTNATAVSVFTRGIEPSPALVNVYYNSFFSNRAGTHNIIELDPTVTASEVKNNLAHAPNAGGASTMVRDPCACNSVATNTTNADLLATPPAWTSATPSVPSNFTLTAPSYLAADPAVPVFADFSVGARPQTGSVDIGADEF